MDEKKWTVYYKHGTQLCFEDELDFHKFDYTIATPTHIQVMSNGTRYDVEPVQVEEEDHLPHYGPSNTWEDFMSKQSPWMQRLLEGVYFLNGDPSPFAICKECEKHDRLLAVSDGSVIFHNMSYGWVVATPNGKILAWSAGPCNGRGSSL